MNEILYRFCRVEGYGRTSQTPAAANPSTSAEREPERGYRSHPFPPRWIRNLKSETSHLCETKMANVPRIPQDVINEILDHLAIGSGARSPLRPALVSKSWAQSCRRHLFRSIAFNVGSMDRWLETLPVPEESPARYVRNVRFRITGDYGVPEQFVEYASSFENVESMLQDPREVGVHSRPAR